jgi:bacterial/archaeal transporter family-2 protein
MLPAVDNVALATIAALVGGMLIALQAPINGELGENVGAVTSATVNFAVGAIILIALTILVGDGFSRLGEAQELPWYYTVGGGALGAAFVVIAVITVSTLGATGITAATLAGQLGASVVLDKTGVLGLVEREITVGRIAGIALLLAGTYLVVR